MSLLSFNNELLFGAPTADGVNGVTGTDGSKILYNAADSTGDSTVINGVSATHEGVEYDMDIEAGYHGKTLAVIDADRFSTQFVFNSAGGEQTPTDTGPISTSPTLRRLHALGYV